MIIIIFILQSHGTRHALKLFQKDYWLYFLTLLFGLLEQKMRYFHVVLFRLAHLFVKDKESVLVRTSCMCISLYRFSIYHISSIFYETKLTRK